MSPGQTGNVPGTKWVCPRDKPRFSPYFTQWKPSSSLGQTQFVPGTFRGRRVAERVYVLKVYVPLSFPNKGGRKQERANANKRRQTLTNASKRRGENASKRKQARANVDKRKQTLTPPFIVVSYTPPLQSADMCLFPDLPFLAFLEFLVFSSIARSSSLF